jgi:hypothetical protein
VLVVGAALVVVVVLVVVLAALGVGRGGGNPSATADQFMTALEAKDIGTAHGLLCDDGQAKVSESALRGDFDLDDRTITAYVLGPERSRDRDGKAETLVPVAINYDRGPPLRLELGVWNEGGPKVCSLNDPGAT